MVGQLVGQSAGQMVARMVVKTVVLSVLPLAVWSVDRSVAHWADLMAVRSAVRLVAQTAGWLGDRLGAPMVALKAD